MACTLNYLLMSNLISTELKEFVTTQRKTSKQICADTELQQDLGIYGAEAVDFLLAYSARFNVDVSNFMAADYFDGDGIDIIGFFVSFFKRNKKLRRKLTVLNLQQGINANKLDEQVINQYYNKA